MSKFIPGNQKHLTIEDRIFIQNELNKGTTFKDIARFLCKDPTTISKKIKARRISDRYHKGSFVNKKTFCVHRYHCRKTNACDKIILCGVKCSSCPTCNQTCNDFEKNVAIVWIEHLMFVMGVIRKSITVRLPINTTTTLKLLIVYIVIPYPILAQGSV